MDDKKYQKYVCVGEDLDDIAGDGEMFPPDPDQTTPEMRDRLIKNLIEEGYLELVTIN